MFDYNLNICVFHGSEVALNNFQKSEMKKRRDAN